MNKNRTLKTETVETLKGVLTKQNFVVVVQASGLTVAQVTGLRNKIRAAGAGYRVTKNTLVRLALEGTPFAGLAPFLKGPTALAYAKEPVAVAKVLADFAKTNPKLKISGASLNGQLLDAKATQTLASLPSLEVLRGKIVGIIQTPATRIAGVLQAPAGQLARVLAARAKQAA